MKVKFNSFTDIINRINELISLNLYDLYKRYDKDTIEFLEKSLEDITQYNKDYIQSYFKENYYD